jgi:glycosyltransferase involved in cell wall biosynthesis
MSWARPARILDDIVNIRQMSDSANANAAVCTIASKNYLAQVRTLAESFRCYHPSIPLYFLLVDRPDGYFDPAAEPFVTVQLADLPIPNLAGFCFQYTILELNTAVKPFLLAYLFDRCGVDRLLYFDPDIKFYAPVTPLFDALGESSVVLLPHLTQPLLDEARPSELDILRSGSYNLGFVGLARAETTTRLLAWWQEKLRRYCLADVSQGLFTDQRWMDLVPGMFEGVRIIRDPGYDVAYWNLQHRPLRRDDGAYAVDGAPLRFFHFSGFDPDSADTVSKHQDRYRLQDLPCLIDLFGGYKADLIRHGFAQVRSWPYAFARFDDGSRIPDAARKIYRDLGSQAERFGDPFSSRGEERFMAWLNEPAPGTGKREPVITRLALEIYRNRADLQLAFPQLEGDDRLAYTRWLASTGRRQHGLDEPFIAALRNPAEAALEAERRYRAQMGGVAAARSRARLVTSLARAGLGKAARRILGARLSNRIRDRMLWGPAATDDRLEPIRRVRPRGVEARTISGAFGVNVVGSLCSESGVGEAVRSGIRALRAVGVPLTATRSDYAAAQRSQDVSCTDLPGGNPYAVSLLWANADAVMSLMMTLGPDFLDGKIVVSHWAWELEHFPEEWRDRFEVLDEIWVASSFCQGAVSAVSPVPVARIPYPVEIDEVAPVPAEVLDLPQDRFIFLYVYDYYSFAERKNPLAALRAFQQAFAPADKAHLVLKATDPRVDPDYHARVLAEARPEQVTIISRYLDRAVLNGLIDRCHCYVSPHRSEGFGLTIAEAMYLGKPVIATAYSGNMDFTRPGNSYLARCDLVEIEQDHGPYRKGWLWGEPDVEHLAQLMRHVYENREEAQDVGARGAREIRQRYSHLAIGRRMKSRLEIVLGRWQGAELAPETPGDNRG